MRTQQGYEKSKTKVQVKAAVVIDTAMDGNGSFKDKSLKDKIIKNTPVEVDLILKGFHVPGIYTPNSSFIDGVRDDISDRRATFLRINPRSVSISSKVSVNQNNTGEETLNRYDAF